MDLQIYLQIRKVGRMGVAQSQRHKSPMAVALPNFLAVMQNNTVGLLGWNWE